MRQPKLLVTLGLTFAAVGTLVVASAPAAPTAANADAATIAASATADLYVLITVNGGGTNEFRPTTLQQTQFTLGVQLLSNGPDPATGSLRLELPDGITWRGSPPSASEGCIGDRIVTCTTPEPIPPPPPPFTGWEWQWPVTAERRGDFVVRAAVASSSAADPVTANDTRTATISIQASTASGTASSVTASAAKVTPAKPKAGSAVTASVRVSAGGSPVRPVGVTCAGGIGSLKLKGTPRAANGAASCTFRTPSVAKGKTLAGSVAFRAGGKRFSKRFSVRLG